MSTKRGSKDRLIHPGEHLAEYLADYGVSQYRLAREIYVPARRINEIILGKRGITADTAWRLSRFFGTTAEFWMHLQAYYELQVALVRIASDLETIDPWD